MHILWKRRSLAALLLISLPLLFSGCGGGGGGAETTTISGLATKGPISGALVRINQLTAGGAAGTLLGSGVSGADGGFAIAIPASAAAAPLLVTVSGNPDGSSSYLSESTGGARSFGPGETLRAVVASGAPAADVTASPLTEAAYQKLQQILTGDPAQEAPELVQAVNAANARIAALTGVADILADPAGDPSYLAFLLVFDRMVVDQGAGGDTATVLALVNQAFLDVGAPAYQTYVQAFAAAADAVQLANAGDGALTSAIEELQVAAANPPAEPDFGDATPPTAPGNLSATASALSSTSASVLLAWIASSDNDQVAGYDVFRNGSRIATVLTPSHTDAAVDFDVSYSYFVVAFDAAGNRSPASGQVTVTPFRPSLEVTVGGQVSADIFALPGVDNVPPAAPLLLAATPSALTASISSVQLSWSAASDNVAVTGYDLYRDGSRIATVTGTSYTDPSLASGTAYRYAVLAFDAAGHRSPLSNELSVTPPVPPLGVVVGGEVQF